MDIIGSGGPHNNTIVGAHAVTVQDAVCAVQRVVGYVSGYVCNRVTRPARGGGGDTARLDVAVFRPYDYFVGVVTVSMADDGVRVTIRRDSGSRVILYRVLALLEKALVDDDTSVLHSPFTDEILQWSTPPLPRVLSTAAVSPSDAEREHSVACLLSMLQSPYDDVARGGCTAVGSVATTIPHSCWPRVVDAIMAILRTPASYSLITRTCALAVLQAAQRTQPDGGAAVVGKELVATLSALPFDAAEEAGEGAAGAADGDCVVTAAFNGLLTQLAR